jgi:hypothetical protein
LRQEFKLGGRRLMWGLSRDQQSWTAKQGVNTQADTDIRDEEYEGTETREISVPQKTWARLEQRIGEKSTGFRGLELLGQRLDWLNPLKPNR